ncbi:hypothetical protein KHA93_02695 [Bacillus sp. FJAT-49732]|uniref:Uncharacterized protein n=1 Tax=Lederbergia citrisecunda TaxID=2833583 RepID=A0A942TKS5_9BACI|nr:hypothetical protein [Lederbergia citrisecunda]MBS4198556.1 hypothetical protein [Lederbergia citrisecunda]
MQNKKNNDIILRLHQSGLLNPDLSLDELIELTEQLCKKIGATLLTEDMNQIFIHKNKK